MSSVSIFSITAILCLQTLCMSVGSTIGQYIYSFYLHIYPVPENGTTLHDLIRFDLLKDAENNGTKCIKNDYLSDSDAQAWAQQKSADLFFWMNLFGGCPLIVMTYLLGLYTPILGKRLLLMFPLVGIVAQFVVWLSIIYFQLPEYWWYISAIVLGISGSNGVLTFALNLIITENTDQAELSSRFVRLSAIQTGLSSIATLAIGYYIKWNGFTDLYWFGFGLGLIAILIVLVCFGNVDSPIDERQPLLTTTTNSISRPEVQRTFTPTCNRFFKTCTVFRSRQESPGRSSNLLLILFSSIFYMLASATFDPFLWYLLNSPFCWTSKDIGNYSAVSSMSYAVLSVLGMKLLTVIGASDAMICVLSHMFSAASSIWLAFARHDWELYAGLLISGFSGYQSSLTTSMMSKWLEPDERSDAFTLLTFINAIVYRIGTTLFNWIYARTVIYHRNFTLLLGAILFAIPMILNLCLLVLHRKNSTPPLFEAEIEPSPLQVPNQGPSHVGDSPCILIGCRSLTSSLRTPTDVRSRANSSCSSNTTESNSADDLMIV